MELQTADAKFSVKKAERGTAFKKISREALRLLERKSVAVRGENLTVEEKKIAINAIAYALVLNEEEAV